MSEKAEAEIWVLHSLSTRDCVRQTCILGVHALEHELIQKTEKTIYILGLHRTRKVKTPENKGFV